MLAPLLLITTALALVPEPVTAPLVHVRPQTGIARTILADARKRSPTIARMLHEIEQSDVILFIEMQHDLGHLGQTTLMAGTPLARYVRMVIDIGLTPDRRIQLIAHELQHVIEVVRAPGVRDNDGMRRLFQRIGWEAEKGSFETTAAREAESVVRREMGGGRG